VTNQLCEKIPFGWINEDVGIWFLEGKSVPYPLPPILTEEALGICTQTIRHVMSELQTPLSIEFPGITDGASFQVGHLDLYEFFADLADQTQSLVTLNPSDGLERSLEKSFLSTDRKQFALFHARLIHRLEDRLSQQFGACLALLEESLGLKPLPIAKDFAASPEYRLVREDLTDTLQTSTARFEIAFLHYILRIQEDKPLFVEEFSQIFLHELALDFST